MAELVLSLILGLQVKHFASDYLLQTSWMIEGKSSFTRAGGYVHAGIHALGTAVVLAILGIAAKVLIAIVVIEFLVHYLLDFAKEHYARGYSVEAQPIKFWALHGLDQFLHQMTYLAIIWAAIQYPPV